MHDQDPRRQLASGAAALGIPLDAAQIEQFLHYLALLRAWNGRARLTSIVDPEDPVPTCQPCLACELRHSIELVRV